MDRRGPGRSPVSFPFDSLRRAPDVEGPGLVASDAADRLILDESREAREPAGDGAITVIGDAYGALALGAAWDGARGLRVHQDALAGERAIVANAARLGLDDRLTVHPDLDPDAVRGARVVLLRLPRSLEALRDVAGLIAAHAAPDVVVYAGGRIKHMSVAMNAVLGEFFARVDVTHARQKSRMLIARDPHDGADPMPASAHVHGLELRGYGGTFGGVRLDAGTRLLLAHLPTDLPGGGESDPWLDLACGNGVIGAWLATQNLDARVRSSDQSAVAVASARATMAANGVEGRAEVVRDDALRERADASASVITLNPPFHSGAAVTDRIAPLLFADAARVLRPGGELWCVWNSPLAYRGALERLVGPTRQVARDPRFTVTVSTRR
nr:methyltransferase [Microbacterium lacticum]